MLTFGSNIWEATFKLFLDDNGITQLLPGHLLLRDQYNNLVSIPSTQRLSVVNAEIKAKIGAVQNQQSI